MVYGRGAPRNKFVNIYQRYIRWPYVDNGVKIKGGTPALEQSQTAVQRWHLRPPRLCSHSTTFYPCLLFLSSASCSLYFFFFIHTESFWKIISLQLLTTSVDRTKSRERLSLFFSLFFVSAPVCFSAFLSSFYYFFLMNRNRL